MTAQHHRGFERPQVFQGPDSRLVVVVEVRVKQLRARQFTSFPRLLRDQGVPGEQDTLVRQVEGDVPGRGARCGYGDGAARNVEDPVGDRACAAHVVDAEAAEREQYREDPE